MSFFTTGMTSKEIRSKFLEFFQKRNHAVIASASLVPENDSGVLFNTAGMQPLIPYLLGKDHPDGKRLVNSQKCVRTQDILEVGDNTHDTFFEMLGNWSLGDYFKKEAIEWSYEFLTSKTEGLSLDPTRLYITCFEGDENAPRDTESQEIWQEIFTKNKINGERIYFRPAYKNWWSVGDNGPCGPDTEMFYDITGKLTSGMSLDEYLVADENQQVVEIWNDVFMQYLKKDGKVIGSLSQKNVDTGSGLERLVMVVQGKNNIFDTDLFSPIITELSSRYGKFDNERAKRIVADHVRTAVFMLSDGVTPSNTGRGYILRRLLRRAIFQAWKNSENFTELSSLCDTVIKIYDDVYQDLEKNGEKIREVFEKEESKFTKTIKQGEKEFEKMSDKDISGKNAFLLFSSYGFPFELIKELSEAKGFSVDEVGFKEEFKNHQDLSRKGSEQKFKAVLE